MAGRAVTLLVALVITSAPVVTMACEITCAARDAHSTSLPHSCHEDAVPEEGAAVVAIHVCGHDESLPTALERAMDAFDTPAITRDATFAMPPACEFVTHIAFIDSSPPTPLTLNSQLRI
jgi:hypothetical protein